MTSLTHDKLEKFRAEQPPGSEPEDLEPEYDAREFFSAIDETVSGPSLGGRPDDFPGYESLSVLQTAGGQYRAGKSYRPDPSGQRRAVKVDDYTSGWVFLCNTVWFGSLEEVFEILKELSKDPCKFVVRGYLEDEHCELRKHPITNETGYLVKRRTVRHHGSDGYFTEVSRQLHMLDFDGVPLPEDMSVVADPEGCIKWAVEHLLPPEFADASFIYQLSASAGLTKLDNELNVHLWFFTNREYANKEMRTWAKWWNAKQQRKIVDPALFTEVQPHYTNEPELLEDLVDPLAGRRLGLIRRRRRTVKLCMPADEEIVAELHSQRKRATKQYHRARNTEELRKAKTSERDDDSKPDGDVETDLKNEADPFIGSTYFEAVNIDQGWRGYLMAIGFEGHIRTQIKAAVASYFYEQGFRGDRAVLRVEVERAIEESPFLDCGEPWSRPRQEARNYLSAPSGGDSNVDKMISYIAALQAERERLAYEKCEPTWDLPSLMADEAFAQIEAAIREMMLDVVEYKRKINSELALEIVFRGPPRIAINCSTGTGKTEAMVVGITELLRTEDTTRVAIAVPTHKLGQGLADRINKAFGKDIAAEWYGTDADDPLAAEEKMCRLSEAAKEVISSGGELQLLCSQRGQKMEYCPHHPKVAGANSCGYLRQQQPKVRTRTRVWIIPSAMLATAPPDGLKRAKHGLEGDFDLLVIDEAPWFNLIPNEPVKVPTEWLSPEWWAAQRSRGTDHQKRSAIELLAKIQSILANLPLGEIQATEFTSAAVSRSDLKGAHRNLWKFKADLRGLVKPGSKLRQLENAIESVTSRNRRILVVIEALNVMDLHISGNLAPSGFTLVEQNGIRNLCLRRRNEIAPAWLKAPTLYLDAADVSTIEIAKAWLPELELKVDARAKAPHMRVTQVVDSQMAYRKFVARGNDDHGIAENNRQRLADLITNRGFEGLVICPKEVRLVWEEAKILPLGWMIWNFGAIRGRDEAREVPQLVVVSRPLPGPSEVEMIAETIFARRLERLPNGEWYPKQSVGRLMGDGTGRRALAFRHPDPFVEAVRFAVCEGELLQAVGRGRGVRRTAQTPLEVLLLTNVPLPIPVDQLTAWRDLSEAGPLDVLATRGVVPLDYAGIVSALPGRFADPAAVKDWFQYHREARSTLKNVLNSARAQGYATMSDFSGIFHNDSTMEDSAKLTAYRYRRAGSPQRSVVLVNCAMHADPSAAVEAVLGPVDYFARIENTPPRRPRRRKTSMDVVSQAVLDQLLGLRSPDTSGLRSFRSS
jgi:hypothetical protein